LLSYDDGKRRIEAARAAYDVLAEVMNQTDTVHFRVFTIIVKDFHVLVSRLQYRSADNLAGMQSIGLLTYLTDSDRTLFATDALGAAEAALRSLIEQINFPEDGTVREKTSVQPIAFVGNIPDHEGSVGAIVSVDCGEFDPLERNRFNSNLRWFDVRHAPNNIDDFEPWSRFLIKSGFVKEVADKAWISGKAD